MPPHPTLSDGSCLSPAQVQALEHIENDFRAAPELLQNIVRGMHKAMDLGLSKPDQTLAMLPSYIVGSATGNEKGRCLALDLGGTNFRVCEVLLLGQPGQYTMQQKKFKIPHTLKIAPATQLFSFIADGIHSFLEEFATPEERQGASCSAISLGFTFSFPVVQRALNYGELLQWNKGFTNPGAVGKDVVGLLQDALHTRGIEVTVTALLNDTVGALMACSYHYPNTVMGAILGTGSNTAYMERMSRITKFDPLAVTPGASAPKRQVCGEDEMVINMEWGAFDNEGDVIPYNRYDRMLDVNSTNPGCQMFEKRISGLYLGEIFRLAILDMVRLKLVFNGKISCALETPYVLDTSVISTIVDDASPDFCEGTPVVEEKLGLQFTCAADRYIVRRVATLVAYRSARFAGAALGAVVLRRDDRLARSTSEEPLTLGIDGSLYEHFTTFRENMVQSFRETVGEDNMTKLRIVLTKDGSGVGAAVAAIMNREGKCL
ncbi:hypothetical protein IWQ60_002976 [Tieghemiomyces parasiticus]|uniref:Phosphotransferase n=1 Tax=Tieghemiomyces parasiticus TaxID=78921 RepID=A0A9W8E147_9FUNG|nr:hypothetical protein IWQ60_002976 [Tieghemiomyces parasiticus]